MSLVTTKQNYNKAFRLYDKLNDAWAKLESGRGANIEFELEQLLNGLSIFSKLVEKIYIEDLKGSIDPEKLDQVKHNKELFRQGLFMMARHAKGIKYADEMRGPVTSYLTKLNLPRHDYQRIAKDIPTLGRKLIGALTHPDNVLDLELKLKRVANGSMNLAEFKKLFDTYKKHILRAKEGKSSFQSREDYQKSSTRVESEEAWKKRVAGYQKAKKASARREKPKPEEKKKQQKPKPEEKKKQLAGFKNIKRKQHAEEFRKKQE